MFLPLLVKQPFLHRLALLERQIVPRESLRTFRIISAVLRFTGISNYSLGVLIIWIEFFCIVISDRFSVLDCGGKRSATPLSDAPAM